MNAHAIFPGIKWLRSAALALLLLAKPCAALPLLANVQAVVTGERHSCALLDGGAVKCWGANDRGQLGIGSTHASAVARTVLGLGSGVRNLAAGGEHTCAVTEGDAVKCWGANERGQLGNGTTTDAHAPVDVALQHGSADAIAAGAAHTCAGPWLDWAGNFTLCWGANDDGQFGDGTTTDSRLPIVVRWSALAEAGGAFTCFELEYRYVACSGRNDWGQLGLGTTAPTTTPVLVPAIVQVGYAVAAGASHACALVEPGLVRCWGRNTDGQAGQAFALPRILEPQLVAGLAGISWLALGDAHSCALTTAGGVRCWGANSSGQLGAGAAAPSVSPTPLDVAGMAGGVSSLAAGGAHTCAVKARQAYCWGRNDVGQLGNGATGNAPDAQGVLDGDCAGFADVAADSPFCASVRWARARDVLRGCASDRLCGEAPVTRLAVAAMMHRLGATMPLPPLVTQEAAQDVVVYGLTSVCTTHILPVAYARSAHVDAVVSAHATRALGVDVEIGTVEGGSIHGCRGCTPMPFAPGLWTSVRRMSGFDIAPYGSLTVTVVLVPNDRPVPGAGPTFAELACNLRVRLEARDDSAAMR